MTGRWACGKAYLPARKAVVLMNAIGAVFQYKPDAIFTTCAGGKHLAL